MTRSVIDRIDRSGGIDVLRLFATALIFMQHALSITDHDAASEVFHFRCGRIGTTLFFVVGGYLAGISAREPNGWLRQRFLAMWPAYWLVLAVSFMGAWITSYKQFDAWQVVSQFAGIGLFTHPDNLVNVVSWFISAVSVLYVVSYLAKVTSETLIILLALSASLLIGFSFSDPRTAWLRTGAMFFVAYLVPRCRIGVGPGALACGGVLAVVAMMWPQLPEVKYGAVAFLLFAAASLWQAPSPLAQRFSAYAYEWYLLHGLALHVALRVTGGDFWPVLLISALVTAGAAIVLKSVTRALLSWSWPLPYSAPSVLLSE